MYGLSVARPYAGLLVAGLKTVENRRLRPPRLTMRRDDGWLVVHASRRWMPDGIEVASRAVGVDVLELDRDAFGKDAPSGYVGVIRVVGWCDLTAGRPRATCDCGPWAQPGLTHWRVAEGHGLAEPVEGRGRLGVWPVPPPVAAAADALIVMANERRAREDANDGTL